VTDQATPAALSSVHAALDRSWAHVDAVMADPPITRWRDLFRTAVAEIAANVIRHAYRPAEANRPFELRVLIYRDRVVARFVDWGVAWEPADEPAAPDPLDLPEGGLGLAVARGALDELAYRREPNGTNVWQLVKRFGAPA
jgi:serine/threonine-protein kinase RsbW